MRADMKFVNRNVNEMSLNACQFIVNVRQTEDSCSCNVRSEIILVVRCVWC